MIHRHAQWFCFKENWCKTCGRSISLSLLQCCSRVAIAGFIIGVLLSAPKIKCNMAFLALL